MNVLEIRLTVKHIAGRTKNYLIATHHQENQRYGCNFILLLVQHDFVYLAKKIKLDGQVPWVVIIP
ncbi:hypothetical protein SAMN05421882_10809 [Nitrosomonas communis]|uniref:Uncharacterized protein n=1 Tax=Nitrosomonas communis TaxID=44574 RepID=A0A1H2ZKD4_9PROT|nr:hypothetical protein SAMN05421882_10809 [Nitrosomonas communis]